MDFDDITFSIPPANIFSGLEPSVAVTLACIPLYRPLLRRGKYSSNGTPASSPFANSSQKGTDSDGRRAFRPLNDHRAQYQLRPMGPKHHAEISAGTRLSSSSGQDNSDLDVNSSGIMVQEHWGVASGR